MIQDTMEQNDDDEIEEEAQEEIDKVLFEITNGALGEAGAVGSALPTTVDAKQGEEDKMESRLRALQSI